MNGIDTRTTHEEAIHILFAQFKSAQTFRTFQEAEASMKEFLLQLQTSTVYGQAFKDIMTTQCQEALKDAQKGAWFPESLGELETCEWHIDPVGVALEHRRYDLSDIDASVVKTNPSYRFPGDYIARTIGGSKDRDTVDIIGFKTALGISSEQAYFVLKEWPQQTYTGNVQALSEVLVSQGAVRYWMDGHTRWPKMYATKTAVNIL